MNVLQCSPMKKDADLRGAEVTPISSTWGMDLGRGEGLCAGRGLEDVRGEERRRDLLDVILCREPVRTALVLFCAAVFVYVLGFTVSGHGELKWAGAKTQPLELSPWPAGLGERSLASALFTARNVMVSLRFLARVGPRLTRSQAPKHAPTCFLLKFDHSQSSLSFLLPCSTPALQAPSFSP